MKKIGSRKINSEWTKLRLSLEFIRKSKENVKERKASTDVDRTGAGMISFLGQYYQVDTELGKTQTSDENQQK